MRRAFAVICIAMLAAFGAAGCGKADEPAFAEAEAIETAAPTESPAPTAPPAPTPTPTPTPKFPPGTAANPLTGLPVDEAAAKLRPLAFMINNRKPSLPQYGISRADMYYEALAESSITRILAVFQNPEEEKIGSMRSARDYFIDFALDHDAIFVHHGGSPQAYKLLRGGVINHIDGMDHDGTIFRRDMERYAIPFNREDSSFTAASRLREYITQKGWRRESAIETPMFDFDEGAADLITGGGNAASTIVVPYMKVFAPYFIYDAETGLYSRFEFGEPQMDAAYGEQLAVANVLVQYAKVTAVPGDTEGRRAVALVGEGEGVLFTGGKGMAAHWEKDDLKTPTRWYAQYGDEYERLTLTPGRTWVCVVDTGTELKYTLE